MAQHYETFGPFLFSYQIQDFKRSLSGFWDEMHTNPDHINLHSAVGVYVWAYKDGKKLIPWNVGKTDCQSFRKRFTQKENSFRKFRDMEPKKNIYVFLLALRTPTGRFRKPTAREKISSNEWLETMLIGAARAKNDKLRNFSKIAKLNAVTVDGYLNDEPSNSSDSAKAFRALLA